jgi:EAL domain-containing protein (putative c-di-GMP-specific phosphodiesterase class I)
VLRAFERDTGLSGEPKSAAVHLQPIIRLDDGSVQAFEALVRWRHPSLGDVPPGELLPLLGPQRAARLGRAVRRKALEAIAGLHANGLPRVRVALNFSAGEVARDELVDELLHDTKAAGLSLCAVEIEITEEVLLDRVSERTLEGLASLQAQGARLVLDDFGTGNSGLSQLLRLSLNAIKLDRRFIARLGSDARAEEIVRATVSLSRGLGLEVVAEGVETEQQKIIARRLGCDTAQGYLFARPMPPCALREWCSSHILELH